jgi:hypothetical protein
MNIKIFESENNIDINKAVEDFCKNIDVIELKSEIHKCRNDKVHYPDYKNLPDIAVPKEKLIYTVTIIYKVKD